MSVHINLASNRTVTLCNHNYSHEGIYHPDRILPEYDLLYMLQGTWEIYEDDKAYEVGPHQVLLLSPNKHHYSLKKCSPEMKNVYIHFSVSPDLDDAPDSNFLTLDKVTDCSKNRGILHLFEKIIAAFWTDTASHKELRLSSLLDTLLLELSDMRHTDYIETDILMTEIVHRIYCTPERFLSPEELARDYGISLRTLSGRFKAATSYSLHQYQIKVKLDMAYDTIPLSPGRGLRDIALSYGFYDEFHFSKLFKRQFGISPSARK